MSVWKIREAVQAAKGNARQMGEVVLMIAQADEHAAGMISGCCRVSRSLRQALCGTASLPRHSLCCTI